MVVDELARRGRAGAPREKFGAEIAEATVAGQRILLCKPQEYMNVSGQAVARVAGFWKVALADTVVVHDELDLAFERLKLGAGGGPGGHNGVRSIISALGDPGFARVRVGIGRPAPGAIRRTGCCRTSPRAEAAVLPDIIGRAADAVETIISDGLTTAMNRFNGKGGSDKK